MFKNPNLWTHRQNLLTIICNEIHQLTSIEKSGISTYLFIIASNIQDFGNANFVQARLKLEN